MNLSTRFSRSNGYRELGMFDGSILILEDIPFDEERWHPLVVEARCNTYRDAKIWTLAITIAKLKHEKPRVVIKLCRYTPSDGRYGEGDCMYEGCKGSVLRGGRVLISLGQVSCNSRQGGRGEEFS